MSADQQAFLLTFVPVSLVVLLILFGVFAAERRDSRRREDYYERIERTDRIAALEHRLLHTQRWPGCSRCQWDGPVADWRESL